MSKKTADVVVIGGGVIGSSIAYHLAAQNIKATLLEKTGVAAGSSGACDGAILLQSKKPGRHLALAIASIDMFPRLAEELPFPIHFNNNGSLVVIETPLEYEAMRQSVADQNHHGLNTVLLDKNQARDLEPALAEHILGAVFSDRDGQINPIRLNLAFTLGARDKGATVVIGDGVRSIEIQNDRVVSVSTSKDRYYCNIVVVAAGALTPEIGRMAGLTIPITPRRGQILVSKSMNPIARHCLLTAGYIAAKFDPEIARQGAQGVSIDQTVKGNVLIGSTREFVGYDRRTTLAGLSGIARRARDIIPALGKVNVIRSFAGLRPYTPDGLPILGPVGQIEGLIMAAGHEGDGIALSPITGFLIAQLIAEGRTDLPLDDFRFNRFVEGKA